jgi:predicted house-cleaning noncanonical NTP pyrophosphatase (MazG superfamily)
MKQHHQKLVRDNIPDICAKNGDIPEVRVLDDDEYLKELRTKLNEEVLEFLEENDTDELGDILEVVYALGEVLGVTREKLERLRIQKAEERGGFTKRLFLESTENGNTE